jgi:hypothetical protein
MLSACPDERITVHPVGVLALRITNLLPVTINPVNMESGASGVQEGLGSEASHDAEQKAKCNSLSRHGARTLHNSSLSLILENLQHR